MIRVLVIDDSALMRKALRQALEAEPRMEVRTARDGQDGLDQIAEFDPTVVTLDINMPVMDGLTCLSRIMVESPRPVVMVSSLTEKGALATLEAMELGAVDYLCKPGGTVSLNVSEIFPDLIAKVRAAARSRIGRRRGLTTRIRDQRERRTEGVQRRPARHSATRRPVRTPVISHGALLVGVSTGGPHTLEQIVPALPAEFPLPVLVCQHMPSAFTSVFASRLNDRCALDVQEVSRPTPIEPGRVYVGRGDADMLVSRRAGKLMATSVPSSKEFLWHPSVERMVRSAMGHYPADKLIAVQLTGMGDDGADAMAELYRNGGHTIAESEETAVVFGMPRELIEKGGASEDLPSHRIADRLIALTATRRKRTGTR